jgi:hypothetical protein
MAKTIGYWKNHASCAASNGKQDWVLDAMLAARPFTLGTLTLGAGDCTKAVTLLNKTPIGGKKSASDPVFNAVAQLVAYELNQTAGAGHCPVTDLLVPVMEAKLVAIGFNGVTYNKPSSKTDQAALAAQFNGWNSTLDSYNNNTLC